MSQDSNSASEDMIHYEIVSERIPIWLRKALLKGANINFDKYHDGQDVAKDALKIYKFKLPDFKFWQAPDTNYIKRSLCRTLLKLIYREVKPSVSFEEKKSELGLTELDVKKIEKGLVRNAMIAFFFMFVALSIAILQNKFTVWLSASGGFFISGVIFWKNSFYLWQIRKKSFDRTNASVKKFMAGNWYLEAFK